MKSIISLIDTNVIINFITKRDDPYKNACFEVMKLCAENVFEGYIAFHSLSIIWYVIKKQETEEKARAWLNDICDMLIVTGATQGQVKEAIKIRISVTLKIVCKTNVQSMQMQGIL